MKIFKLIIMLIMLLPSIALAADAFLKESNNAPGIGDKILKESNATGDVIVKEFNSVTGALHDIGAYEYFSAGGGMSMGLGLTGGFCPRDRDER